MSSGDLSYLHPGAFNGLTRLSKLYLHENRLDRLVDGTFQGLSGVEEVWLYENEIEEISTVAFTGMPLLELLVLWGNRFDALPRGVFSPLTKLKEVWMGDSQLTTLPSGAFENLGELTLLHLYQNLLSELPDSLFTGLSELANLNLDENPGTPFTLTVHLERTDTSDLDAPGPATLVAALAEGAPFSMRIPLSVDGGTISTDTVVIEGGQITSAEFTVTQDSSSEITRVIVGPAPAVPAPYRGIDVVADDTLTLFSSSGDGESDMASRGLRLGSGLRCVCVRPCAQVDGRVGDVGGQTALDGHQCDTGHRLHRGLRALQTWRPCQISRCARMVQTRRGNSAIRSRSIFSGVVSAVNPCADGLFPHGRLSLRLRRPARRPGRPADGEEAGGGSGIGLTRPPEPSKGASRTFEPL